jgi:2-hydroxychromene-2-carboxylate isomerase
LPPTKVFWVFDVLSPFSYLAFKQLTRLPEGVEVVYVPVLFAGLLKHYGQLGPAEMLSKRRFTYRFVVWRARKLGVPMKFPPTHPFNPLMALRLIVATGSTREAVERVFDAVFLQGLDVSSPEVIADLASRLGIADPQAALSATAVKEQLRRNTDWAIEQGVFGVPTIVVGKETFWGHDAFEMALDYLADPAAFVTEAMRRVDTLPVGVVRNREREGSVR